MTRESDSLAALGRDPEVRAQIVAALLGYEQLPEHRFTTVRDDVTGPVVDALHAAVPTVRKELSTGVVLEFPYRSKIARDFVMSTPERPDHVWEPQTTKLLLHLATSASDVIVGGAYFGDHAILIADAMRGRGTCHAFEANADQAAVLDRNAALNGLDNVRVNAVGLWSDDVSRLSLVGDDATATPTESENGIATTTVDAYVAAAGIDRVGLIMLDLEGAEHRALLGAERVLREHGPHVVFEVHRTYVDWSGGLTAMAPVCFLTSLGYTVVAVRDFQSNHDLGGRPVELVPLDTAYLDGPPHGFNLLAVRDKTVLDDELFQITPGVSPKLLLHRDPRLHHPVGGL